MQCPLEMTQCSNCGHNFRQQFIPPVHGGPVSPSGQTQAFFSSAPGQAVVPQQQLAEMARRSNESRKLCLITFWIGLFCLWPVWIVSYLEYTKIQNIKQEIAAFGIDVRWWQITYGARDVF
jgi:hypothetical protein